MTKNHIFISVFAALGALYSGILAYGKLTTGVCTFNASCPYLFGLPVCVYGFFGFLIVLLMTLIATYGKKSCTKKIVTGLYWLSFVGILFALYFFIQELFILAPPEGGRKLSLGYPSCLYGLVLFSLIFCFVRKEVLPTEKEPDNS